MTEQTDNCFVLEVVNVPLPTVAVEVASIGMSVELSVESVLGSVIKAFVLVVGLRVDVPITAVKTQTKLLRLDEIHTVHKIHTILEHKFQSSFSSCKSVACNPIRHTQSLIQQSINYYLLSNITTQNMHNILLVFH